jgi:glutamate synthase domain-containing protein 2
MTTFIIILIILALVALFVHDKYIQRRKPLLINYPIIGRLRYVFEALRDPLRQYFADETFYDSRDKIDWVYQASKNKQNLVSFAPNQPLPKPKFLLKHSNSPLNDEEVEEDFSITYGQNQDIPFKAKSIISRSAMSDGSISPEGTRAFVLGAKEAKFPINTGEGGLTGNFLISLDKVDEKFMTVIKFNLKQKYYFKLLKTFIGSHNAISIFKALMLPKGEEETFRINEKDMAFFRINWDAPIENFPKNVPQELADIIFQVGSGLYGVRNEEGGFNEEKYQKLMSFCKMTEIKIAQGAKQTGGKLPAHKVTPAVAYYRGVEPWKDLFSPNRFPYAHNIEELFDFIAKLQSISKKPVGIKIVISSARTIEEYALEIKKRIQNNIAGIPDFITIDGGDGGTAAAPLDLMERIGLQLKDAVHIANDILKKHGVRDQVKIIASSRVLTPDDIVIILALGADAVALGRGFMMSAGCIRARMCSGYGSHQCPVGLATQNPKKRRSYVVHKYYKRVANYHNNLIKSTKTILAIMGLKKLNQIKEDHLLFVNRNGHVYEDVKRYYEEKITTDLLDYDI